MAEEKAQPTCNADGVYETDVSKLPSNTEVLQSKALSMLFTVIRDKNTTNTDYVFHSDRLCRILAEEGLARLCTKDVVIETPCGKWKGPKPINYENICAVSIVRSGDILLEAVRAIVPGLSVGKILMQRDESTKEKTAVHYYTKLPKKISTMDVILCDPMLATGGSACGALKILIDNGCKEENILFLNTVSCPEGLWCLQKKYPKVRVVTSAVDSHLNEHKFIVPGLGDFGDRYYRTGD
eukprot:685036_1